MVSDCRFLAGAGRQIGLAPDVELFVTGSIFQPTDGHTFLPDPGTRLITVTNSAVRFDSRRLIDAPSMARGEDERSYAFFFCTITDVAGTEGDPNAAVLNVNDASPRSEFAACIIDVPAFTNAIVRNDTTPGGIPVAGDTIAPANMVNAAVFPWPNDVMPDLLVTAADPLLASDGVHLTADSPAIDASDLSLIPVDIDGEARPEGAKPDIGCDEFVAPGIVECVQNEVTEMTCDDGVDNDCDGAVDDADEDCLIDPGVGPFLRGDCDGSGVVGGNPTDAVILLGFAFRGGERPGCLAACDAEANGSLGVTDALRILRHSFLGLGEPDSPFPDCASSDKMSDVEIGCEVPACQ